MQAKYRRLPIEVMAEQFAGPAKVEWNKEESYPKLPDGVCWCFDRQNHKELFPIVIGEPGMWVSVGDWIVELPGSKFICIDKDDFEKD